MTEQEVKEIVEKIVKLEQEADDLTGSDNFIDASTCTRKVQKLEEGLEREGFFLGESGANITVYHASLLKVVKDEWIIFDRANWQWRQP